MPAREGARSVRHVGRGVDQGRRNPPSRRENEGVELVWSQAGEHRRSRARRLATQRHHGFGDSFGIRGVHHREGREEVGR